MVVMASLPLYAILSIAITPTIRARLHEKFNRGAENQSFLVEAISGIQTVKALAVEPPLHAQVGRAAGRLCAGQFPRDESHHRGRSNCGLHPEDHDRRGAVGRGLSGDRRGSQHRAVDCVQYAVGASDRTAAASGQSLAGVSTSRHFGATIGGRAQYATGAFVQSESDDIAPSGGTGELRRRDVSLSA